MKTVDRDLCVLFDEAKRKDSFPVFSIGRGVQKLERENGKKNKKMSILRLYGDRGPYISRWLVLAL
jgi:hypothetical protein